MVADKYTDKVLLLVGVTLGEPPHIWLAKCARELSSVAKQR